MRLYHGTNVEIKQIDLAESRVGKDFGLGFYLTPDRQVAKDRPNVNMNNIGWEPLPYMNTTLLKMT